MGESIEIIEAGDHHLILQFHENESLASDVLMMSVRLLFFLTRLQGLMPPCGNHPERKEGMDYEQKKG
ncbi:hypothetical protein BK123_11060 [Paenibacillus lautus]|uniref:Uncharacterized protein n=1 Tax=Paenibacillus lautus TaxID=1401 RepID=A0A1R1B3P0_PAELA|nr:hypothetical protein BK123_11060 [Paenibacillus lautus]